MNPIGNDEQLHVHELTGCGPVPLAHYLKALGVLRLVSEQADPMARGWWEGERFRLVARLDRPTLLRFFLEDYAPTPLVAPWNGGSGFYPKDKPDGIQAIRESEARRLEPYRAAIHGAQQLIGAREERPSGDEKTRLLQRCRQCWEGPQLEWLGAVLVLDEAGEPSYPSLLGTGGNDGRLDYTNNFMQWVAKLFHCGKTDAAARPGAERWLNAALFGGAERDRQAGAIGQFLPGDAGGANSGVGFEGKVGFNAWDFVLMLEGTIGFAAAVTRRTQGMSRTLAASPFAMRSSAAGYGSAAAADEGGRGEQWMPMWSRPATFTEVRTLIGEGRCQVQRSAAERPVDVARSLARLGVARGISAFERYGYVERYGRNNFAVPLGRWEVRPVPRAELLDDVAGWVEALRRAGGDRNAPAGITRVARRCEEAMLDCCRPQAGRHDPAVWERLLIALGEAENQLIRSPRFTAGKRLRPLGAGRGRRLRPGWIEAACDGSAEWRLALSLAGLHGGRLHRGRLGDPVRRHFLPLDDRAVQFATHGETLGHDVGVVAHGTDLARTAVAILRRRMMEAGRGSGGATGIRLLPMPHTSAKLGDIAKLLNGELDEARVLHLARPLMALDWEQWQNRCEQVRPSLGQPERGADQAGAITLYGLFKLCHYGGVIRPRWWADGTWHEGDEATVRMDPSILARLAVADLAGAARAAVRRLRAAGLRPRLTVVAGERSLAQRLGAALIFPLSNGDVGRLAGRLTRSTAAEDAVAEAGASLEIHDEQAAV